MGKGDSMNKILQFVLILVIGLVIYFLMNQMMRRLMVRLSEILYKDVDPQKYLEVLNSWQGKMFFSRKTRSLMAVDAYLMLNQRDEVEKIFSELDQMKLNPGNKMALAQKELSYYVDAHQYDKALAAFEQLKETSAKFKQEQVSSIMKECTYLVEIYIHHNTDYLDEILDLAGKMKNDFYQGIFLYRAAKLYYYKGDEENCRIKLKEAKEKTHGTAWEIMIDQMLNEDLSLIAER